MALQASVIIPTFQDWGPIQACLDCLAAQTAGQTQFEVIVVNNNDTPDVPPGLRLPDNARVIHEPKPGSYAARNTGVRAARGDLLFFTDSDCQPDPGWIENGLAAIFPLGPRGRIAGAVQMISASGRWTAPELYDSVHGLLQEAFTKLGWCATANMVVHRTAFDVVGPFDEDQFSGCDRLWNEHASALGFDLVYRVDVLVRHPARQSLSELVKKRRRLTGGSQALQASGKSAYRPTTQYLSFINQAEFRRTMTHPGLTEWQRFKVLMTCFALGGVAFAEVLRLRYLSGRALRS